MRSEEVRKKIAATRVGDRMESDHHALEVKIGNDGERSGREGEEGKKWERSMESGGPERFRQKVGGLQGKGWAEVEETLKKALKETERELRKEKRKRTQGGGTRSVEGKRERKRAQKVEEGEEMRQSIK